MKRLMTLAASALLVGSAAMAQSHEWKSYSYVEAQGGLQLTSTNAPMDKLFTPTAAFSVGHYFTPVVGARLHVNAWQSKSGFKDLDKWNEFNKKRVEALHEQNFEMLSNFVSFRTKQSDDQDGGNALFAALEYWDGGFVYNGKRNAVAMLKRYQQKHHGINAN